MLFCFFFCVSIPMCVCVLRCIFWILLRNFILLHHVKCTWKMLLLLLRPFSSSLNFCEWMSVSIFVANVFFALYSHDEVDFLFTCYSFSLVSSDCSFTESWAWQRRWRGEMKRKRRSGKGKLKKERTNELERIWFSRIVFYRNFYLGFFILCVCVWTGRILQNGANLPLLFLAAAVAAAAAVFVVIAFYVRTAKYADSGLFA